MGAQLCIGGFTSEGGPGLLVTEEREASLVETSRLPLENPSWLTKSGNLLYAVTESEQGAVRAVNLADPTRPTELNAQPTGGASPTHCALAGNWLLSANYDSGSVSVHPIKDDGSIGERTELVEHGDGAHAHQILPDPSGNWVLAVDIGIDTVFVYRLLDGRLHEHSRTVLPSGSGPRHLAFHPNGELALLVHEYESIVTALAWDAERGKLEQRARATTRPESPGSANNPAEIAISSDGRFCYVSNRGDNTIARLSVQDGRPSLLDVTDCGGDWPRQFALREEALYVGNERSGQVIRFDRDPETGMLSTPQTVLVGVPGVSMILPISD